MSSVHSKDQASLKALIANLQTLRELGYARVCPDCVHWLTVDEGCSLADGKKPPVKVLVRGCERWEWDDVPF